MSRFSTAAVLCVLPGCAPQLAPLPVAGDFGLDSAQPELLEVSPAIAAAGQLTESVGASWETSLACASVVVLQPHRMVCGRDGAAWLIDESVPSETWLADAQPMAGAHVGGQDWLSLDGELVSLVDEQPVPLDLGLSLPIESMVEAGGSLWLHGAGRLFEVVDGAVREVQVDGEPAIHDFAATADRLYLATPSLLALERGEDGLVSLWRGSEPVDALAADEDGLLWLLSEDSVQVYSPAGPPSQLVQLPGEVHGLVDAGELWLLGDGVAWRQAGQSFTEHSLSTDDIVAADSLGRLLQLSDEGLLRHSVGRPVAVVGLAESLDVPQQVQLLPSDPTSLSGLSAWVDQRSVTVDSSPYRITLDPELITQGAHELRFLSESEQGDHVATWPLWVGSLPETSWEDIQQISETNCLSCHGGDTVTRLESADDWRARIDTIIALVVTGEMPLGGTPLSDEDIVRIRAWKHGGFE